MQIILEKDEYKNLLPNALKDQFIEQIREIVANSNDWDGEASFNSVKDKLEEYDKKIAKQAEALQNIL